MPAFPQRGLYVIINADRERDAWLKLAEAALRGGCDAVQYRSKGDNQEQMLKEATALTELCHRHNVPCIINDHVQLAARSGADGVHLGKDDPKPEQARKELGETSAIGVSCYNSPGRAAAAKEADYLAFGSVHRSPTKPEASRCDYDTLRQVRQLSTKPIVAIGGVTIGNAMQTLRAGADILATLSDLELADDPEQRTAAYKDILKEHHHE